VAVPCVHANNLFEFLGSIKCVKSPGAAAEVFCSQEGLCYMSLIIMFGIFKTNLFSNFVMNTMVDADGLSILEQQCRYTSLAVLRIFVVNWHFLLFAG
jgi:hypothetical protein